MRCGLPFLDQLLMLECMPAPDPACLYLLLQASWSCERVCCAFTRAIAVGPAPMAPPIPRAATAPQLHHLSGSSSPRGAKSSSALPTHWRRPAAGADAAPLLGTRRRILAAVAAYTLLLVLGLGVLYSGLHPYRGSGSLAADGEGGALSPAGLERALRRRSVLERPAAADLWPPSAAVMPNVEFNNAGKGLSVSAVACRTRGSEHPGERNSPNSRLLQPLAPC